MGELISLSRQKVYLFRAGTELRCKDPTCDTLIATFRIDRLSTDRCRREDMLFPAIRPMPEEGTAIVCSVCGSRPKSLQGEEIGNSNKTYPALEYRRDETDE